MLPDSAAVEPLLAERDALRGWLTRLNEAGSATPEAVRAKVRADYEERLDGVTDRLRAHADTIAARLEEDRKEFEEQLGMLHAAETALAEAALRHAVGEYDSAKFEREQARQGDEIVRCRLGRDAAAERIERMETVHSLVTQPVVPVESLAPTPVEVDIPNVTPVEVAATPRLVQDDHLDEALLSVFDDPKSRPQDPGLSPLSFRPGSGMVREQPRPATTNRPVPSMTEMPPLGLPDEALPRFSRPIPATIAAALAELEVAPAESAAVPSADEVLGDDPIVATAPTMDGPIQATRTSRCGECGAMNKPLEWYCEKCGAELTAA